MSKLSFRARALDATKTMPVYRSEEIPDLPDFAAINRAVPQMPTGMEKEEETEHHLQRALSAQQVYGTAEALVIPVPDVDLVTDRYKRLYGIEQEYKPPKQYVHVQAFGMEQEIPDYDMDSEDETWLNKQAKKMEVTPLQFENMMDRLEKGSGQMVVTLPEAKALLKEDDDLIIAVYDYWLNKRLRMQHPLIPTVKTEKRDGSTTNNPYVAFRRRTEKMQTRKNRKNDEASYEKMLKLRRDLNKALTILEMMKRREKSKKEMLQLTIEVYEKRYQMQDWGGSLLAEAMAQRHKLPAFIPLQASLGREWTTREDGTYVRKKREYKKRKHKASHGSQSHVAPQAAAQPQFSEVDVLHPDVFSSEDDGISPVDDDPDGIYAFRRKANCHYHAPIYDGLGNWPWCSREEGGFAEKKYRYSLTSLTVPRRCIGFARRRVGRGGRILLDRAFTPWDDSLGELDLTSSSPGTSGAAEFISHIKENKFPHFRPRTPTEDVQCGSHAGSLSPTPVPSVATEFNVENFLNHQEQLLQMQRHQQEQLLKQETVDLESSFDLEHSFSSQPTSRFTLDSASARFAASAVCNNAQELIIQSSSHGATLATTSSSSSLTNGPVDTKTSGLSTSPAETVLQLNFPLPNPLAVESSAHSSTTSSISLASSLNSTVTPVIARRAVSSTTPAVLKLASTPESKNDSLPKENHESMNNLVKETVVAMEVT